jgi:predicted phage terminase large subunit-like protein
MSLEQSLRARALAELELRRRQNNAQGFDEWLKVVSPEFNWDWAHLVFIRSQLAKITNGTAKRMMLCVPPRHGKSEQVTIRYPAWVLEKFPEKRIVIAAYNQTLANKFSRKTKRIAASRFEISKERSAVEDWETTKGGSLRAVGVGGGITGQAGDLIIIDDPVKSREEANSETYREKVWDWYTDDLYTRLEPNAAMILIMTRWHEDDLAGRILKSETASDWIVINLPALAEPNDLLGRAEGQALCPDRYDEKALEKIKKVLRNSFSALYMGRPTALEGDIFKREWWRYYRALPLEGKVIQSWDTAFKDKKENDYSVCTTWLFSKTGVYLIDVWRGKVLFPELKKKVIQLAHKYKPAEIDIEDKASGISLFQELKRKTRLPIKPIPVDKDKIARANAVSAYVETGNVYLPENAAWVNDYVDELANFPNDAHDDQVDSTTQALANHMYRGTTGFLDYYEQLASEAQKEKECQKSA